jgi:hypothetical protein
MGDFMTMRGVKKNDDPRQKLREWEALGLVNIRKRKE